mgnify:CR=1 FL=1
MKQCFDCDPSREVRCGIFHLLCHVCAQKVLDLGAFQIFDFQIRYAQPVLVEFLIHSFF